MLKSRLKRPLREPTDCVSVVPSLQDPRPPSQLRAALFGAEPRGYRYRRPKSQLVGISLEWTFWEWGDDERLEYLPDLCAARNAHLMEKIENICGLYDMLHYMVIYGIMCQ
jgi:hypothetical protein